MWAETRRYWRVAVVAVLGGLLAFALSFTVDVEYESESTFILHSGQNSYIVTDDNATLGFPIQGSTDYTAAFTMGQTIKELSESRQVAEIVADELGLDDRIAAEREDEGGILSSARGAADSLMDFLVFGESNEAPPSEQAVLEALDRIRVDIPQQSFVMRGIFTGETPEEAHELGQAATDAIVRISADRFRANAEREAEFLAGELERTAANVSARAQALADFLTANELVSAGDATGTLDANQARTVPALLEANTTQLAVAQARLAAYDDLIAGTSQTTVSENSIITGRSETVTMIESPSMSFAALETQRAAIAADVAGLQAEQERLTGIMGTISTAQVNQNQVEIARFQADLSVANTAYNAVSVEYQQALISQAKPLVDMTVQDAATVPVDPARPVRYLYLVLGLFVGALAGSLLTWVYSHRPLPVDEDDEVLDLRSPEAGATPPQHYQPPQPVMADAQHPGLTRLRSLSEDAGGSTAAPSRPNGGDHGNGPGNGQNRGPGNGHGNG